MLLTWMMLAGCNRYWYDTVEEGLGNLSLKPGVVRVEDEGYRLDPENSAAFEGLVWLDGLDGEQEWNQINVELEWTVSSAAEGQVPRWYGVSLWNLNDLVDDGDGLLLASSAALDAIQVDAHLPSSAIMLGGAIAAPTDGAMELPFALGIMIEDISNLDGDYALSGSALLRLIANGRDDRGTDAQPLMGMSVSRVSSSDDTGSGSSGSSGSSGR